MESEWLIRWITVCAKLHNFVIRLKDPWTDDDKVIELDEPYDILAGHQPTSRCVTAAMGAALLDRVMAFALNFHRARGASCLQTFENIQPFLIVGL